MPAAWQNFVESLCEEVPGYEELSQEDAHEVISDQLKIVWGAELIETDDTLELVFKDAGAASWFVLRWQ